MKNASNAAKKIEVIPFRVKRAEPSGLMSQMPSIHHGMKCLKDLGHLLAVLGMVGEYALLIYAWLNQRMLDIDVLVILGVIGLLFGLGGTCLMLIINIIADTVLGRCAERDIQALLGTKVAREAKLEELQDMIPADIFQNFVNYSLDDRAYEWRLHKQK